MMDNFDPKKFSKITYPLGVNETVYLWLAGNGKWMSSDKEQLCVFHNFQPAGDVAVLNAKLHPINSTDRDAMIVSLEEEIKGYQRFLDEYGRRPAWKASTEVKDARRGIKRMEKEITHLGEKEFSGGDHQ